MRQLAVVLVLLLCATEVVAQDQPSGQGASSRSHFGTPVVKYTVLRDEGAGMFGGRGGWNLQDAYPEYDMSAKVKVLFSIYVLPAYQGRGIGSKAMAHMEELHPAEGWVLDTPAICPKNRHFYEKGGYIRGASRSRNVYTKGLVPPRGPTAQPSP